MATEKRLPRIHRHQVVFIILSGLTGIFAYNIFFFTGLTMIHANRASLIIATNPIFISLASALFFKERLTLFKSAGLVLSVSGALVIISGGNLSAIFTSGIGKGELTIFGCVISWVSYSILGKPLTREFSPLVSVCYSSLAGTVLLAFPVLLRGGVGHMSGYGLVEWGSLFYLGFFGTVVGFYWYYQGIQRIGPTRSGVFINFVPVSAIILAYVILDEPITRELIVGAVLVATGVYLTNRSKAPVPPLAPKPSADADTGPAVNN